MKFFVLPLIMMLALSVMFAGCGDMKNSGKKSEKKTAAKADGKTGNEIDELRFANRQLKKENETLRIANTDMQDRLTNLEKRDEQLTQKISKLRIDLKQRKLLTDGLLADKKQLQKTNKDLTAQIERLQRNPGVSKKPPAPTAAANSTKSQ
ncbi:MAG: hypothetical protein KAR11_00290 [Phycisphaerae bacterium]|nr:hypothetical protein [Phycisphaerae bacterium]